MVTTTATSRVYFDSCVFIDAIQETPGRIDHIRQIIEAAKRDELRVFASTLAIAEVAKPDKATTAPTEEQLRLIHDFFENDYLARVQVDTPVARLAARIVRDHSVKPPDAIHLATALRARVDNFYTYDDGNGRAGCGLLRLNGAVSYDGSPALRIVTPQDFAKGSLFGGAAG
ncbi:MAG TPA: type II toxin-antitoxin system VapC family toxin [Planctomycetota bacterium]|nr:type II toxin-antitoxin system VapC family toxin [Planctomycetota bacterium]